MANKNRFALCAHFPCGILPGKAFRGPRCGTRIGRRLLPRLRSRPGGEPANASPTFDGGGGRNSMVAFPIGLRSVPFPRRAAGQFAGHDCDIMIWRAWPPLRRVPQRGSGQPACGSDSALTFLRQARERRAISIAFLLIRHHKKSDGLRREAVIADSACRPARRGRYTHPRLLHNRIQIGIAVLVNLRRRAARRREVLQVDG